MNEKSVPEGIIIIAGKGAYPVLLARSAREQGVKHITAVAFLRETDPMINQVCDRVEWIRLGQLGRLLDAMQSLGHAHAVMAGQITPTHLFTIRMDSALIDLLRKLPARNADTIFSAITGQIERRGIKLLDASRFMEKYMPRAAGCLTQRAPDARELKDMALGLDVAHETSRLEIGQTVLVKEGTILAVEAFEGTDAAILRAGALGGAGAVLVKIAKRGHDMRFDIPVIGMRTVKSIRKARVSAVCIETGRAILLEQEKVLEHLNRRGVALAVKEPRYE